MSNHIGIVPVDGCLERGVFGANAQVGRQVSRKLADVGCKLLQQVFVLSGLIEHIAQLAQGVLPIGGSRRIGLRLRCVDHSFDPRRILSDTERCGLCFGYKILVRCQQLTMNPACADKLYATGKQSAVCLRSHSLFNGSTHAVENVGRATATIDGY